MARLRHTLDGPARRLLTEAEAASYCGAPSLAKWRSVCDVKAIRIYSGNDGLRYDREQLDAWISRNVPATMDDIGDLLDHAEEKRRAGRRHQTLSQQ